MNTMTGHLKREIAEGKLCLKADEVLRFRFEFCADDMPIGCYALRSTAPFEVRAERAWNVGSPSWDTTRKLFVPVLAVKRFWNIKPSSKITIRELPARGDNAIDVVSFTFAALAIFDGPDKRQESGHVLQFEVADLQGVRFEHG